MPTYPEIEKRFTYHPTKDDQVTRYQHLREKMKDLAVSIFEACPDSRERAVALGLLEFIERCEKISRRLYLGITANAAIARNE